MGRLRWRAGVVALIVAAVAACSGGETDDASEATTTTAEAITTTDATTTTTAPYVPVATLAPVISAWAPGGLDAGFVAALPTLPGVVASTVVQGGRLMLADGAPPGMGIPLDALAIDPATYPAFVAPEVQEPLARLERGDAVLGATSAALRGAAVGSTLTLLDGTELDVAAVLPDDAVAGAELVVAKGTVAAIATDRYALVAHAGDLRAVAGELRAAFPAERPLRVREAGEVRYLRHGDGVLTDAEVKTAYGELAFTEGPTRDFAAWDTAFTDAHVGSMTMPILGTVECNVAVLPALRDVLREVDELQEAILDEQFAQQVADAQAATTLPADPNEPAPELPPLEPLPYPLLEPDADLGCWNPRLIDAGAGVSRHAYGIAIDLRAPATTGVHDPRVIDIFEDHGFTWGGDFLTPDPIHFEWVG
jgi:hypothetical protein